MDEGGPARPDREDRMRTLGLASFALLAACASQETGTAGTTGGGGHGGQSATSSGTGAGSTTTSTSSGTTTTGGTGGAGGAGGASSTSTGGTGGTGGGTGGAGGAPPLTFSGFCNGTPTTLIGTVLAPNGNDPLPNIEVYVAKQVNPFPAQFCDKCDQPIDEAYVSTTSSSDGSFALSLDGVPYAATVDFVVRIGRFRKVTSLAVNACTTASAPLGARKLPGSSAEGEIPKIAVSTGNVDHLDDILDALGITEYDCYEGRATGSSSSCTLVPGKKIPDVLAGTAGTTPLSDYHMLFLSCAPGAWTKWSTTGYGAATMAQNINAFVTSGGRLIATDTAYDYLEQAFPDAIEFAGPPVGAPPAGVAQPVAGANVGCSSGAQMLVPATVDDAALASWLSLVGVPTSPNVDLKGFLQPWSVMESLPASTTQIVHGQVSYDESLAFSSCQSAVRPLTSQFDVAGCGRVIYSSYHTLSAVNPQGLTAQEKILEYLMFSVASCHM